MGCGGSTIVVPNSGGPSGEGLAVEIYNAVEGLTTDDAGLIAACATRSSKELAMAGKAYEIKFGRNMIKDIKDDTSFNYQTMLLKLVCAQGSVDAHSMRWAMLQPGTDEERLEEVLLFRTAAQMKYINEAYTNEVKRDLLADIKDETSNYLQVLYVNALTKKGESASPEDDVAALYAAGEGKELGTCEKTMAEVLGRAEPNQIVLIKDIFEKKYGKPLESMMDSELGVFEAPFKRACMNILNGHGVFLAKRLKRAMSLLPGTDDTMLMRLLITNRENGALLDPRDPHSVFVSSLKSANAELKLMTNRDIPAWIKDETSGAYRDLCLKVYDYWSSRVDLAYVRSA